MTEFWEENFIDKQEMWGLAPARSAVLANDFFKEKSLKNILVPGAGYGRNAKVLLDGGMHVVGIEISKTAIELARKHYGDMLTMYHGSIIDMPFDEKRYDGVFCHALIHLLDKSERRKFLLDCYNQLTEGGYMIFTVITKEAETYGKGTAIGKDRFEMFGGVTMFFYDWETIQEEFADVGLMEVQEITENYPFYFIICKKTVGVNK